MTADSTERRTPEKGRAAVDMSATDVGAVGAAGVQTIRISHTIFVHTHATQADVR